MNVEKAFAKILKKLRLEKELSQERFGYESGLHRTYVSQLERGLKSPSLHTLVRITNVLEISMSDFMALIEQELDPPCTD